MNLIERLHSRQKSEGAANGDNRQPSAMPSFIIRHYDLLWRVLSRGRTTKTHRATLELAGFGQGDDLLDIGCGTGALVLVADQELQATGLLVGLDVEPGMISQARRKAQDAESAARFEIGSITSVPYPDESFDVVTSSLMLHHVPEDDHSPGLAELHRVLRPGGRILIADINLAKRSSVSRAHGTGRPTEDTVRRDVPALLEAAGFDVVRIGQHDFKALSYVLATKTP